MKNVRMRKIRMNTKPHEKQAHEDQPFDHTWTEPKHLSQHPDEHEPHEHQTHEEQPT